MHFRTAGGFGNVIEQKHYYNNFFMEQNVITYSAVILRNETIFYLIYFRRFHLFATEQNVYLEMLHLCNRKFSKKTNFFVIIHC